MKNKDNDLIANFMGLKPSDKGWYDGWEINKAGLPFAYGAEGNGTYELKFQTSWDWLMPVGKKCKIIIHGMYEHEDPQLFHRYNLIKRAIHAFDLELIYKTIVDFVKWFNTKSPR